MIERLLYANHATGLMNVMGALEHRSPGPCRHYVLGPPPVAEAFPAQLVEPAGNAAIPDLSPFLVLPEVQRFAERVGASVAPVAVAAVV
jgi:hypothetical protein